MTESAEEAIGRAGRIMALLDPRYGDPGFVPMIDVSKEEALKLVRNAPADRPVSVKWALGQILHVLPFGL